MSGPRDRAYLELRIVDGDTHFDFCDRREYVGPAIAKIGEFFTNHL